MCILSKELIVDSGRQIRVYDDVLEEHYRSFLYRFALASNFSLGWSDSVILEKSGVRSLHCVFSPDDLQRLKLFDALQKTPLNAEFDGYEVGKVVLNLSVPSDANYIHAHGEDKVLLIYVNLEWQDGWHGETLFYSQSKKEVVFANPYTPNRVVVFDAKIPHTIRPQSSAGPLYRFTLAIVLNKVSTPSAEAGVEMRQE
jgi:hypothetical protein